MGLDVVQLLCDVEKEFNISITDYGVSVNDLVNVVWLKLNKGNNNTFIYKRIFLLLKEILISLDNKEESITINTELISLIAKEKLSENWNFIKNSLNLKLPRSIILNYASSTEERVETVFGKFIYKKNKQIRNYTVHSNNKLYYISELQRTYRCIKYI